MEAAPHYVTCVCTANVCRSPMAEALLRHALAVEPEPLRALQVVSAGVSAWDGYPITENSARALKKVGLDATTHRSQALTRKLLQQSVLVICMTEAHRRTIYEVVPGLKTPVILMREKMPGISDPEVPDPYGADLATYEGTRDAIVEAVPSIVAYLRELMGAAKHG
jgi:protein-tyrosine phosphatase